jgi:hypothetical protein
MSRSLLGAIWFAFCVSSVHRQELSLSFVNSRGLITPVRHATQTNSTVASKTFTEPDATQTC